MKKLLLVASIILLGASLLHADPPREVVTLMATIQKACQARDLTLIKSCYYTEGVSALAIDQSLDTWQEYWNQAGDTHWAFDNVEFKSLDELLANKSMNQRALLLMTQPHKMGEHTYEPNLKVIGFVTANFKSDHGSIGTMAPVGLAPDGTAKIALLRMLP